MIDGLRLIGALAVGMALVCASGRSNAGAQGTTPQPRPGLTAQQTKDAIKLAKGAMTELRKKTEGASLPTADVREYVVGVELLVGQGDNSVPPRKETHPRRTPRRRRITIRRKRRRSRAKAESDSERQKARGPWSPRIATLTISRSFRSSTWGPGASSTSRPPSTCDTPLSDDEFADAQTLARREKRGSQTALRAIRRRHPRRSAIQPVQPQGRPTDPSGRASDLPGGKAGAELSPPPGRPDDAARSRHPPPSPSPRSARRHAMRLRRSLANPINSEPMLKRGFRMHAAADPQGRVSRAFGSGSPVARCVRTAVLPAANHAG